MKQILFSLLLGVSLWGYGDGAIYWTPHGCDDGKATASKHGGHGKGESAMFALMNIPHPEEEIVQYFLVKSGQRKE